MWKALLHLSALPLIGITMSETRFAVHRESMEDFEKVLETSAERPSEDSRCALVFASL